MNVYVISETMCNAVLGVFSDETEARRIMVEMMENGNWNDTSLMMTTTTLDSIRFGSFEELNSYLSFN